MTDIVDRLRTACSSTSPLGLLFTEAADEILRLRSLVSDRPDARAMALEEAARLIDEGFQRPGIKTIHDKCSHDKYQREDCEPCATAAIRALAKGGEA